MYIKFKTDYQKINSYIHQYELNTCIHVYINICHKINHGTFSFSKVSWELKFMSITYRKQHNTEVNA